MLDYNFKIDFYWVGFVYKNPGSKHSFFDDLAQCFFLTFDNSGVFKINSRVRDSYETPYRIK